MSLNETVCLGLANGAEMHLVGTAAQSLGCAQLRSGNVGLTGSKRKASFSYSHSGCGSELWAWLPRTKTT
jgi:hypothetical protein